MNSTTSNSDSSSSSSSTTITLLIVIGIAVFIMVNVGGYLALQKRKREEQDHKVKGPSSSASGGNVKVHKTADFSSVAQHKVDPNVPRSNAITAFTPLNQNSGFRAPSNGMITSVTPNYNRNAYDTNISNTGTYNQWSPVSPVSPFTPVSPAFNPGYGSGNVNSISRFPGNANYQQYISGTNAQRTSAPISSASNDRIPLVVPSSSSSSSHTRSGSQNSVQQHSSSSFPSAPLTAVHITKSKSSSAPFNEFRRQEQNDHLSPIKEKITGGDTEGKSTADGPIKLTKDSSDGYSKNTTGSKRKTTAEWSIGETVVQDQAAGILCVPGHLQVAQMDVRVGNKIASGGGGDIFHVRIMNEKCSLFVTVGKKPIVAKVMTSSTTEMFTLEVSILGLFSRHPYVATMVGFIPEQLTILLTFYEAGSLDNWIKTLAGKSLYDIYDILQGVSVAVKDIHNCGIVHYDIKPANILLEIDGEGVISPKITDFGVSNIVDETILHVKAFKVNNVRGLSTLYAAPERFNKNNKFTNPDALKAADIYSFSMVMYQLFVRFSPWSIRI